MGTGLWVLLILFYFTPTFIAYGRSHNSAHAIAVCNFILGWTVIGFFVALIWSFTGNTRSSH